MQLKIIGFEYYRACKSRLLQFVVGFPRLVGHPRAAFVLWQVQVADKAVFPCGHHVDLDVVFARFNGVGDLHAVGRGPDSADVNAVDFDLRHGCHVVEVEVDAAFGQRVECEPVFIDHCAGVVADVEIGMLRTASQP